ncbi:MAG: fatty acid desaturase [Crocosphaera sp.]
MKTVELSSDLRNFYLSKLPKDIFDINPTTYWLDFLTCAGIGWTAFILLGQVPLFSLPFFIFYMIAIFSLYRAAGFVHEICHQQHNPKFVKGFFAVWHIMIGLPLLFPSFYYDCHLKHHDCKTYKTFGDPQYPPVKNNWSVMLQLLVLTPILLPLQVVIRFLILTPLSLIFPRIRPTVESKFSSIAAPTYVATFNKNQKKQMVIVELMTFLWLLTISACFFYNIISFSYLFLWYFVAVSTWILNFCRSLAEHSLDGLSETSLSLEEQLLDSYTYPRGGWRQLIFTPGSRYHALHHIFPAIPYHNLPMGHEILKENLPEGNLYAQTERPGFIDTVKQLLPNPSLT